MSIKFKAIQQAMVLLAASGAEYAIRFEEKEYGNAKLEVPKVVATRVVKYRWGDIYQEWVKNAKPGDVFRHEVQNLDEAKSLRSSLSGQLCHYYGTGTYMTTAIPQEGGKYVVEALYVGPVNQEVTA